MTFCEAIIFHTDVFLFRRERDREDLFFCFKPKSAKDSDARSGFGPVRIVGAGQITACFVFIDENRCSPQVRAGFVSFSTKAPGMTLPVSSLIVFKMPGFSFLFFFLRGFHCWFFLFFVMAGRVDSVMQVRWLMPRERCPARLQGTIY